jgi:DNA-binding NtrC family response regulator
MPGGPVGGEPRDEETDLDVPFTTAKEQLVAEFEQRYLTSLLQWAGGNISRAARRAGMDRMYLHRLLQKHGLQGTSFKA